MHIVICGFSRSGTTLLQQMLKTSVTNYKVYEFEKKYKEVKKDSPNENIITKRPNDIEFIKNIVNEKHTHPIVLLRDPRSILTSFHKCVKSDYFCSFDKVYFTPNGKEHFQIKKFSFSYVYNMIEPLLNSKKVTFIKYEDLITDSSSIQENFKNNFNMKLCDDFCNFYKYDIKNKRALNGVRPLDKSSIDKWKDDIHIKRIFDQFTKHPKLFNILIKLGYEKDRRWFDFYTEKMGL
jgi:hypothetical protein